MDCMWLYIGCICTVYGSVCIYMDCIRTVYRLYAALGLICGLHVDPYGSICGLHCYMWTIWTVCGSVWIYMKMYTHYV